ncbi:ATP synthase I chain [Acetoanaerobium noterae]|uniref:ATP synthase I chain n=1 Tax=Acetoanaerobium noterae TaxID=745369 RepID=A0A1T5A9C9_9FIRM|nr:ATP synthase subunit I [Acetoanaerobium noterae]MBP8762711.1 ATP synthase subunit I [Acetoanaerobium sp.]MBP9499751.1 ATP synthase subunit I [Acetoanaerobium sp.]MBP9561891.1 ATP synthase subunit I [Acetoanaerobium sp.]SKB31469.1 ATP synthase I chain [Acetoanaerobium noterae]
MDATLRETIKIFKGIVVLDVIFIAIIYILGKFDIPMLQGILIGSVYALLNFRLIAVSLNRAVQMSPGRAQVFAGVSYVGRLALTAAIILAAIKVDYINAFGVIVPMFFPKIIIVSSAINRKV